MAVEVDITPIVSGYNITKINDNFNNIKSSLNDAVSRTNHFPNMMENDLDFNSNDILNVGQISTERLLLNGDELVTGNISIVGPKGDKGDKGDEGPSGPGSGDMLSTNNLTDVNNAASAFENIKQSASTTYDGVIEIATNAEVLTGTASTLAVVPSALKYVIDQLFMGKVFDYVGTSVPQYHLFCFGQAVSRTTYAGLFNVIGTTFGAGDGTTTFNLPDIRGRVIAGKDNMGGTSANRLTNPTSSTIGGIDGDVLGNTGGAETHTQTVAQLARHRHGAATKDDAGGGANTIISNGGSGTEYYIYQSYEGNDTPHNNVQPTIIMNKIIYTGV